MLVVHATKKLLDRVGRPNVEPTTRSTTVLGSWYPTVLFWRPQITLLANERTLLPVLMPLAPAATLLERLPSWLAATLDAHGVPRTFSSPPSLLRHSDDGPLLLRAARQSAETICIGGVARRGSSWVLGVQASAR